MEIALWTDDVDAAFADLVDAGARALSAPHDWLGGTLRVAWVADPDDNPVELVERRS
jgi:catechol 2,3-dioxygenase-like lactoylglutathione lyase family enzyme